MAPFDPFNEADEKLDGTYQLYNPLSFKGDFKTKTNSLFKGTSKSAHFILAKICL